MSSNENFEFIELIGEGRYGEVHKIYNPNTDRIEVLKIIKKKIHRFNQDESFNREKTAWSKIDDHVNIATLYDAGYANETHFFRSHCCHIIVTVMFSHFSPPWSCCYRKAYVAVSFAYCVKSFF